MEKKSKTNENDNKIRTNAGGAVEGAREQVYCVRRRSIYRRI